MWPGVCRWRGLWLVSGIGGSGLNESKLTALQHERDGRVALLTGAKEELAKPARWIEQHESLDNKLGMLKSQPHKDGPALEILTCDHRRSLMDCFTDTNGTNLLRHTAGRRTTWL